MTSSASTTAPTCAGRCRGRGPLRRRRQHVSLARACISGLIDVLRRRWPRAAVPRRQRRLQRRLPDDPDDQRHAHRPAAEPCALGLVPFRSIRTITRATVCEGGDRLHEHFGETRDERLREFHEMNERTVVGLWEAGLLCDRERAGGVSGAPAGVSQGAGGARRAAGGEAG